MSTLTSPTLFTLAIPSLVLPSIYTATGLPEGATLNQDTGEVSGVLTANSSGTMIVTGTGADAVVATMSLPYRVVIEGTDPSVTPLELTGDPTMISSGSTWSFAPGVVGGSGTKTYALASGALPVGITLNATTGVISGASSAVGMYPIKLSVTDTSGTAYRSVLLGVHVSPDTRRAKFMLAAAAQYRTLATVDQTHSSVQIAMTRLIVEMCENMIGAADDTIFDVFWGLNVDFKDTFFEETTFFRQVFQLQKYELDMISVIYTAFRQALTVPSASLNYTQLESLTQSVFMSEYLQTKLGLN